MYFNADYKEEIMPHLTVSSKTIADFPMGDCATRQIPICLPNNYDPKRSEPYPVIFQLVGYGSHPDKFMFTSSMFERPMATRYREAMANKTMPEAIIAFPDCGSKLGGSQYINSSTLGHYMDFLCDAIIPAVDEAYHTHKHRDYRAITGHSSGGYGAMVTAMLRPDCFAQMASSAGDCFFEALFMPLITPTLIAIKQAGDIKTFVKKFLNDNKPGRKGNFEAMMMLAMAPCFAPNKDVNTIFGDLFFSTKDGTIRDDIWQQYLAWDPVYMVKHHVDAMAQMNLIRLDCGISDPYGMQWGQRQIANFLQEEGIAVELNEYSGGHNHQSPRFIERIADLIKAMPN
jgi:enterochelin esterase family protein